MDLVAMTDHRRSTLFPQTFGVAVHAKWLAVPGDMSTSWSEGKRFTLSTARNTLVRLPGTTTQSSASIRGIQQTGTAFPTGHAIKAVPCRLHGQRNNHFHTYVLFTAAPFQNVFRHDGTNRTSADSTQHVLYKDAPSDHNAAETYCSAQPTVATWCLAALGLPLFPVHATATGTSHAQRATRAAAKSRSFPASFARRMSAP